MNKIILSIIALFSNVSLHCMNPAHATSSSNPKKTAAVDIISRKQMFGNLIRSRTPSPVALSLSSEIPSSSVPVSPEEYWERKHNQYLEYLHRQHLEYVQRQQAKQHLSMLKNYLTELSPHDYEAALDLHNAYKISNKLRQASDSPTQQKIIKDIAATYLRADLVPQELDVNLQPVSFAFVAQQGHTLPEPTREMLTLMYKYPSLAEQIFKQEARFCQPQTARSRTGTQDSSNKASLQRSATLSDLTGSDGHEELSNLSREDSNKSLKDFECADGRRSRMSLEEEGDETLNAHTTELFDLPPGLV